MAFTFRPGIRESIHLLISLAGGTGSGKTFSALLLALGLAGPSRRIAFIDTENRRALMYADQFQIEHCDLSEPFTPARYVDALKAGAATGAQVLVIDSMSHEWAGTGGILDQQEAILDKMAGDDFKRREACRMSSWIKPKTDHKRFVTALLQLPIHVVCCFRAEPKIEMVRKDGGGWEVRAKESLVGSEGWIPVAEKNLPFEMTASFLLKAERPGVPIPIKLPQPLAGIFPAGEPITERCGVQLAAWAAGGVAALTPAVDWAGRIDAAQSLTDLKAVGLAIVDATMSDKQRKGLRAPFAAKQKTLTKAGAPAAKDIKWK